MKIRPMTPQDREAVLPMVDSIYHSIAVEHCVPRETMEHTFSDAVSGNPMLRGFVMEENGEPAGFAYLTYFYSCENAGMVVMIEELFIKEEFRGKGIGQQFFDWLFAEYPEAARFRLEVTKENPAAHLYERNGFRYLDYKQMVIDCKNK